ncbi:MAG: peroxiredoxin [Chromatiales bacterium]|jgi:peroxiredoxin Q/BCP|nr:peroxiredoxin [Chromatiales bacterium]MDP6151587.1 peroxiredoxin [Gammaproteobacteria bacterium]MDP7094454.1 peroxiredoxin [Gammaproteobacteria bacterium]MDP7270538.1 peroxiredoxin [Gammaproteobacteria bacterium]HJP04812.1 peroxiredoxin [Gammaproteobacteria bacterium]
MNSFMRKCLTLIGISLSAGTLAAGLVGSPAPDFHLQDQNGEWHSLEQYRGQWVVLYFYPKDDTPGCTKEACAFRDNIFAFEKLNAIVLGVSLDNVESHAEFAEKYSLPFSILADSEKQAASAYGVVMKIGPMELASRQSFLIDPEGNIVKHYAKVNAEKHSEEVLVDLGELTGEGKESDS